MEEYNFHKSKPVLISIAAILLVSFIIFYNLKNKLPKSNPIPTPLPSASITSTPSLEVVRNTLLSHAKIEFPKVVSFSVISLKQLPKDLNVFLFDNSTNISVKTVRYMGGAKGYQIEYITNLPWRDINNKFLNLTMPSGSSWSLIAGRLAELFGFVEMDDNHYQVRVDQSFNNNQGVSISIQIISK